ncbi:MAG: cobalt-precorrin-5B (C(1))-methyltransferase CbiD [Candidatus Nanoarchaeia archaeon]
MEPRKGLTTGTCAAAAAWVASHFLAGLPPPKEAEAILPDGKTVFIPVNSCEGNGECARASVIKDAGDDPDITNGVTVEVTLRIIKDGDIVFRAGSGVGVVTKPGLAVKQGEPAINPVPRRMICEAIRRVISMPVEVTISIPGGEMLAERTFNPKFGIKGGLSILGTTGIVRPFSLESVRETIRCAVNVASASKIKNIVFVPGNIGRKAAISHFVLREEQVIEISNEWGFAVDLLQNYSFVALMALGHPGKLAKLIAGDWDTHSSRSRSAVDIIRPLIPPDLNETVSEARTVEAMLGSIPAQLLSEIGANIAEAIRLALINRNKLINPAVVLINLRGEIIGTAGDFSQWKERI